MNFFELGIAMDRRDPIMNGEVYHIYNRGNNHMRLFYGDEDYRAFTRKLFDAARGFSVTVVAYVLMPNHYHLLLFQPKGGNIPATMHSLATSTAKRYNLLHRHVGHLFQGAYRYELVRSPEDVPSVARYIHLNPVRARLAHSPENWSHSSFRALQRLGNQGSARVPEESGLGVLDPGLLLARFGGKPEGYVAFVHEGMTCENEGRLCVPGGKPNIPRRFP